MLSQLGICRLSSAFYRWSSAFGLSCGRLGEAGVSAVRWSKWFLYLPGEVHVQYTHTYTYTSFQTFLRGRKLVTFPCLNAFRVQSPLTDSDPRHTRRETRAIDIGATEH